MQITACFQLKKIAPSQIYSMA